MYKHQSILLTPEKHLDFFSLILTIFFFLPFNLQELCLHTKLLAPINCPIVDFLMKAPDPPPAVIVRNAVQMLKVSREVDLDRDSL